MHACGALFNSLHFDLFHIYLLVSAQSILIKIETLKISSYNKNLQNDRKTFTRINISLKLKRLQYNPQNPQIIDVR